MGITNIFLHISLYDPVVDSINTLCAVIYLVPWLLCNIMRQVYTKIYKMNSLYVLVDVCYSKLNRFVLLKEIQMVTSLLELLKEP